MLSESISLQNGSEPLRRGINPDAVLALKHRVAREGLSYADLAREIGHSGDESLLRDILSGRRACMRGKSHAMAVKLGLKGGLAKPQADND